MKNITLSADERLIEQARQEARSQNTTLNHLFREWLTEITQRKERIQRMDAAIARLERELVFDRKPTRDELNERQVFP